MKRALSELNDEECVIVYQKLDLDEKRAALKLYVKNHDDVHVYTLPNYWRDILDIIVRFIDLQTWGRLHRACHLFNESLPNYPDLVKLETLFMRKTITNDELYQWKLDVAASRRLCIQYYTACVRRIMIHAYGIREEFRLEGAMARAKPMLLQTIGIYFPFGGTNAYLAMYPYGFIRTKDRKPLGNIFTTTWKDSLIVKDILRFKSPMLMNRKQRKRYNIQKAQLGFLPWA